MKGPIEIFAEYARLSGAENNDTRDFDISKHASITSADYNAFVPMQWPQPAMTTTNSTRFFASGGFYTPNKLANFVATPFRERAAVPDPKFPFVLNTGRIRDQWHTMTRSGKAARLFAHYAEPFVEVHPDDADRMGLADASLAEIRNSRGHIIVRTLVTARQLRGSVFVPMHWTDQHASSGRIGALIAAATDPVSGQPELKAATVDVSPFDAAWYGFAICRSKPASLEADYWAIAPVKSGWRIELAGRQVPGDWDRYIQKLFGAEVGAGAVSYHDAKTNQYRAAVFDGERLVGALFVAPEPVAVPRSLFAGKLDAKFSSPHERMRVLAGRGGADEPERGPIVCACFEVGLNQIVAAVATEQSISIETVGRLLKAGTNCGSCRPEIGRIIHERTLAKAG